MTTKPNSPRSDSGLELGSDNKRYRGDKDTLNENESCGDLSTLDSHTYLSELLRDQTNLRTYAPGKFKCLQQILDREISDVVLKIAQEKNGSDSHDKANHKIVPLSQIVMVPVDKYPSYNFVGRILGPRGMTVRQLEEQTGCKIMVRGRGSIKGKIRDRGSEDEPLHILVQCEDYPDRVKEKMQKAVERVNELLTPPADGKDELKRKQLVELAIINGTYRPTNATKVALRREPGKLFNYLFSETPSPLDAAHLSTGIDNTLLRAASGFPDCDLMQKLQLIQLLSCAGNSSITDYLLRCSMPNHMLAPSYLSHQPPVTDFSTIHSPSGGVHQATLQEYLDATAILNSVPSFVHDGSGDGPKK